MSNIGIFYYNNINAEKVQKYIKRVLDTILVVRKPKCQIFKKYSKKELCGLINWGAYPVTYTKIKNTHIFFDGYVLDKEPNNRTKLIDLYNKYGINFIEKIPFFGNILIKTPGLVYIITSYHALFELYCYMSKNIFCVAPAVKFIFPIANQDQINVNKKTVVELLSLEYSLNRKTLYNEIVKLDSSSVYIYDPKENKCTHRFYEPYIDKKPVNYKTYLKDVEDLYEDAICKVINPLDKNYKISLCFSGGTDSSYLLSHLIRKNIPVTTYTHIKDNKKGKKLLKLIKTLRENYPNIEIELVKIKNCDFPNFEELTKKYEQLIDLQETKRLQKDLHLIDFHKAFDSNSIFTEGTVGDVIMAASKLKFLIEGTKNAFFRKLEKVSSYFFPNKVTLFFLKRFSSMVKPSDYYIQQIKEYDWPSNIVNNIKIEIDYNYEVLKKKYNLTDNNIRQFELYIIENRIFGYTNDHCYVGRNYNEYFLSPFYENNFFNYVLSIDYSKKFNAKLNYDLNKRDNYFYNIPIENTNKTIESSFFKYRLDRDRPLSLFVSRLKHIVLKQKIKLNFKVDLNMENYIRELLSKCSWNHLISESIFKSKIFEIYYILLFEKKMKEYQELYNKNSSCYLQRIDL